MSTLVAPTIAAPRAKTDRRNVVLAVVCAGQFVVMVDDTIVNTALPSIQAGLGFSASGLAWVVNAYLLLFGGLLLLGGRAGDVLGHRRVFLFGLALFTGVSVLCGLAPNAETLVGARALQGLAGALLSPAALAILLRTFPEGAERTRSLGVWAALLGLGAATGLVAGGAITEVFGWRWIFLVNLPIGLAVLWVAVRRLPADLPRRERVSLDVTGAVLSTAGLLLLVYTVVETHDRGWGSLATLGGFAGAATLLLGFVLHERSAKDPLVPLALVRRRTVAVGNAVMLVAAAGLFAMFFFVTLYMQVVKGWTPLRAGVSALAFSASLGVASGVATKLVVRVPVRVMLSAGLLTGAGGMLLMTRLEPGSTYAGALLPALVVCGLGLGLAFVPLASAVTSGPGGGEAGVASGLLSACQQIGAAIGIAVLVTVATDRTEGLLAGGAPLAQAMTEGFQSAFLLNAALLAAAAVIAPVIGRVKVSGPPPLV